MTTANSFGRNAWDFRPASLETKARGSGHLIDVTAPPSVSPTQLEAPPAGE